MAFMVPVMKNNYEIYKDTRLRKKSECSNASSSIDGTTLGASMAAPITKNEHRTWESCSSTPCRTKRAQMQRSFSQKIPRNTYKSSQGEDLGAVSPTRSFCQTRASPSTSPNEVSVTTNAQITCSENGISKFHRRLVDKLCKSLRRDGIKES